MLLDDPEGMAANLIQTAGGNAKAAQQATEELLRKQPKVEGGGAGQLYMAPETARLFDQAEQMAKKAGDCFVTVEQLLLALAMSGTDAAKALKSAGHRPQGAEQRHQRDAQGPHGAELAAPRKATTRSRSTRATSPRPRAPASSTR